MKVKVPYFTPSVFIQVLDSTQSLKSTKKISQIKFGLEIYILIFLITYQILLQFKTIDQYQLTAPEKRLDYSGTEILKNLQMD